MRRHSPMLRVTPTENETQNHPVKQQSLAAKFIMIEGKNAVHAKAADTHPRKAAASMLGVYMSARSVDQCDESEQWRFVVREREMLLVVAERWHVAFGVLECRNRVRVLADHVLVDWTTTAE